jgi:hypothetical protein
MTRTYEGRRVLDISAHLKSRAPVSQSASVPSCMLCLCAALAFVRAGQSFQNNNNALPLLAFLGRNDNGKHTESSERQFMFFETRILGDRCLSDNPTT